MLPLALLLAPVATASATASASASVRVEARAVRLEGGTLILPPDALPPRPRPRACPRRSPPGCRLIVFDLL